MKIYNTARETCKMKGIATTNPGSRGTKVEKQTQGIKDLKGNEIRLET